MAEASPSPPYSFSFNEVTVIIFLINYIRYEFTHTPASVKVEADPTGMASCPCFDLNYRFAIHRRTPYIYDY